MEHCIVSWNGIGKSLIIRTGKEKKKLSNNASLEDVVCLLDDLSKGGGWVVRSALGEKGKSLWTLVRKKGKKKKEKEKKKCYMKHLIVYWHGKGSRVEMFPRVLKLGKCPNMNSAKKTDILNILNILSNCPENWIVSSSCSSKGVKMWTLSRIIK